MSVNFQKPVSSAIFEQLKEAMGEPVATDNRTFLYDRMRGVEQRLMKEIANAAKQPVAVELNTVGDIKVMDDGQRYELTPDGWRLIASGDSNAES